MLKKVKQSYCLIVDEHGIDVSSPFQFKRGLMPTQVVFRMPGVPQHFFQLPTLTRWYTSRLDELQSYAEKTQARFIQDNVNFTVMCGSRHYVLRKIHALQALDKPITYVAANKKTKIPCVAVRNEEHALC